MHYTGVVYRPPFEASSLLLEVTRSCSHNQCTFCSMYRDTPFSVAPMEQVEEDIREAAVANYRRPDIHKFKRVFLESGDAFALSADRLITICKEIRRLIPSVDTIAMYATILNVQSKSDEELRQLRELGVNDLNIGVETGLDSALQYMNKGYDSKEAIRQLERLRAAGIDYALNIIYGIGGPEFSRDNASATADLLNRAKPNRVFTGTLHSSPGCPLHDDKASGAFTECTIRQYLDEGIALLEQLEDFPTNWFALHPSNIVQANANFPADRQELIDAFRQAYDQIRPAVLDMPPTRGGEGAVIVPRG